MRTAATAIVGAPVDEIASRVRSKLGQPAPWKPRRSSPVPGSALNRSVEKKRQEILPAGIDEPIIAYPGASDALAAQLEQIQTRLQRKVENLAPGELAQRLQEARRRGRVVDRGTAAARRGPRTPAPGGPGVPAPGRDRGGCPLVAASRPPSSGWLGDPENTVSLRVVLR